MKINFKYFLAGIALPLAATFFSSGSGLQASSASTSSLPKPYIIEDISPQGTTVNTFVGKSDLTDAYGIAQELGAKPFVEDKYVAFPAIEMGIGGKITIYRAPTITILDGKKKTVVRSWQKTVGDLFDEQKIELLDQDKTNFSLDTAVEPNMQIKITRVAIGTAEKKESIDFKVIKKEDKTLDQGKTRIDQAGVAGVRVYTYQIRREDGVEVSRKLIKTEVTKQPVDQILIIGTKPVITGWCKYNDLVLDASIKNGLDPNKLCDLMHKESNGHADSSGQGGAHQGLFQYDPGFWGTASAKAGYAGASIWDAKAQIYTTAWALTHGYQQRW